MSFQKPNEINVTPLAFELIWTAMLKNDKCKMEKGNWKL
jgi:hypothetical protein